MTPRCSTCDRQKMGGYRKMFEHEMICVDPVTQVTRTICKGYFRNLPKTSPHWCPRRKANQQHRLIVAGSKEKEDNTDA